MTDDTNDRSPDSAPGEKAERSPTGLMAVLRSAFGGRQNGSVRAEIEEAIAADEAEGADFSPEERSMLRAILRLGDMRVDDVMVPRADIESVSIDSSLADLLATVQQEGHSRFPVYRETIDEPVGMVHIKDVMVWIAEAAKRQAAEGPGGFDLARIDLTQTLNASGLVRPVLFVPPTMPARALLKRMQASRTQMALVIDEYGGTDGLVSLEDLIEVIVGDIEDEHDLDEEPTIRKVAEGQFIAHARTSVEDARALIGESFRPTGDAADVETVGGIVYSAVGRIPSRGEIVEAVEGYDFEILDADARRIIRIRIRDRSKAKPLSRPWPKAATPVAATAPDAGTGPG
jgi:CBS domain containing-hemolysin-like protein